MPLFNYFNKFGTVVYNENIVNNILVSVRIKDVILKNSVVFYPYTVKEGERPDTIAHAYYEDSRYAWLVLLSNSIYDPYYQWPLTTKEFNSYILKKYNTVESAINKILFFRNNWYNDDSVLSKSQYDSLPTVRKKYWQTQVGFNNNIVSYVRKQEDLVLDTNKVIVITVSDSSGFNLEDTVTQSTAGVLSASGVIKEIVGNDVYVIRVQGAFGITTGGVGSLKTSSTSRVVSDVSLIDQNISNDESIYWEAVSAFDYENELNESRKNINLIDSQYVDLIEDQIGELLG